MSSRGEHLFIQHPTLLDECSAEDLLKNLMGIFQNKAWEDSLLGGHSAQGCMAHSEPLRAADGSLGQAFAAGLVMVFILFLK